MIECRKCEYYYKQIEKLDDGTKVQVGTCIRDIKSPDDDPEGVCMEFREKWYLGNENGFRDSLEEEMMSIDEYEDYLHYKDRIRLQQLRKLINDIRTDEKSA